MYCTVPYRVPSTQYRTLRALRLPTRCRVHPVPYRTGCSGLQSSVLREKAAFRLRHWVLLFTADTVLCMYVPGTGRFNRVQLYWLTLVMEDRLLSQITSI